MALSLRRLAGLVIVAAAFGCPKAVNAPIPKVAAVGSGVQIGQLVRLDASQSSDPQGRDMSFAWQFTAIPIGSAATLNDAHSATPSFLADVDGEYDVQVVVSNAFVSAAAATVQVKVSKCGGRAPVFGSNALTAKDAARPTITDNFAVGATIVLASDVSDPDNSTTDSVCQASQNQAVSYSWKLVGQPAASVASLNNTTASSPSFVADVAGTYTVRVVATDSTSRSSVPFDQTFTVSNCGANAPTISSVAPITEQLAVGKTIQLTAIADDADNTAACQAVLGSPQTFSYRWTLPQLPNGSRAALNSAVAQNPSFSPDIDGDYVVSLVVTDSTGLSSAAKPTTMHIPKCGNNAPVAAITGPTAGFLGVLVQFGQVTTDADGKVNGGPLPSPLACSQPIDQTVTFRWSILALPPGSNAQLNSTTGTNPSFTPDVAGDYTIQLVATDQSGLSSRPATQSVHVISCGATPPGIIKIDTSPVASVTTVNAGTAVALVAPVTVPDNSCLPAGAQESLTYQWSMVSKPAGSNAFIVKPGATGTAADPASFTPDVPNGTYQVELVLSASNGLKSAPAFFSIFTRSCGANAPTITTGAGPSGTFADNTSPNAGFDTVTLTAHGGDLDNGSACSPALGTPQALNFQWTMVSRPSNSGAAVAASSAATDGSVSTFKPDVIGTYQFSVIVTDSTGLSSPPSFVTVRTSDCGSHAPVIASATATPPLGVTQPKPTLDQVSLSGTVTDLDDASSGGCFTAIGGQPKTYVWTVVSHPAGSNAVISSPSSLTGATFTPDVPGAYQFQLDATDSLGLKAAPAFATIVADSCSLAAPVVSSFTAAGATQFTSFTFPAPVVNAAGNNNCLPAAAGNSFNWSIVSAPAGSAATLSNPADAAGTPTFTPDKVGSYQFALTVTNGAGIAAAPVFFNVTAATCGAAKLGWSSIGVTRVFDPDPSPTGTTFTGAGIPARPSVGAQVTVSALASDPNSFCGTAHLQPFSYQWTIVAAPSGSHAALTSATDASPAFVPDVPNGTYQLSVVATDALGNTSAAPNFITVTSSACGANVPSVTITPADLSGASGIFTNASQALSVTTTDADTDVCTGRFHITTPFTYSWSIASQPVSGHATLTTTSASPTSFQASVPGLYSVHVIATAPNGISSDANQTTSFVAINAKACGNSAPVVNSISTFAHLTSNALSRPAVGQQVDLTANTTDADGSCGDAFAGGIASWAWSAVSLPSGSTAPSSFTSTSSNTFNFAPDVAGTFTYSVVATDNTGLQSAAVQVSISTAACGPVFGSIGANSGGTDLLVSASNAASSITSAAINLDVQPSVSHTGSGSGSVGAKGNPNGAHSYLVTITTGGAVGTAQFTVALDGGAASGAVATAATSSIGTGVSLIFAGTFAAGDTYAFSTSTGSFVTDSCVKQPSYGYSWLLQKPANSQATLSTLTGAGPQVTPDVPGTYAVQLQVTDNAGLVSAPATLTLNVANCGSARPVIGALVATPSSPNAGATVQMTAPISDLNGSSCNVANRYTGNNVLTVFASSLSSPAVFVNGALKVAGLDYTVGGGNVTFNAAPAVGAAIVFSSFAPAYQYQWSLISVPGSSSAALSSQTAAAPSFVADLPNGTYQVALTVTDQLGNVSDPQFTGVTSTKCGANAPALTLTPAGAPLNANSLLGMTASATDADNNVACAGFSATVTSISYSIISAPAGSQSSLVSTVAVPVSNLATPPTFTDATNKLRASASGTYVVQAIATASNGLTSAPATATFNVAPTGCGTNAPVITQVAATDTDVTGSPSTSRPPVGHHVALTASHFDADETVCAAPANGGPTYAWTLVSEPTGSAVVAPTGPQTNSINFLADRAGTFVWSVIATDLFGLSSAPTTVTVATGSCGPTLSNLSGFSEPIAARIGAAAAFENTGGGYSVTQGATMTLSTATPADACVSGGAAPTMQWSLTAIPAGSNAVLSGPAGSSPSFTADLAGTYGIQLVVTDNAGNASVFTTTIAAGACTAGPTLLSTLTGVNMYSVGGVGGATIFRGDVVKLALPLPSGISTPSACSSALNYEWSMIGRPSGSQASLSSSSDATPSFSADVAAGVYQFALVVRDGLGNASAPLFFSLTSSGCGTFPPSFAGGAAIGTFSAAPRANAPITFVAPTALDGNAACPAGRGFQATPMTYSFSVVSSPAGAQTSISQNGSTAASLVVSKGGDYTLAVIATDARGRSTAAVQTAIPGTSPAVSNCGAFPPVTNQFALSQSVPGTGTQPGDAVTTTATPLAGGTASSTRGFYFGFPVAISAPLISDADTACTGPLAVPAQTVTNSWSLVAAPAGSHASLGASNGASVLFTPDVAGGPYTVALTTTDNLGYSSTSTLSFSVNCGNSSPVIAPGSLTGKQTSPALTAPAQKVAVGSPVSLDSGTSGNGITDADGTAAGSCTVNEAQPFTYQWSFTQVPAGSTAPLLAANTLNASFTPDAAGPYTLSLTVTDPQGHASAPGTIVVDAECGNIAPSVAIVTGAIHDFTAAQDLTVNGGTALHIVHAATSANNSATLLGAGLTKPFYPGVPVQLSANVLGTATNPITQPSCPNVIDTITYQWSIAAQPAGSTARINNASAVSPSFTPDLPGPYDFQLVLTDQNGRSSTTSLSLDDVGAHPGNVGGCGSNAPTVVASAVNGPVNVRTTIDATGSQSADDYRSPGGAYPTGCGLTANLSYQWVMTHAPAGSTASLSSTSLIDPSFVPDLLGQYVLQVTASDGKNSASKTVSFVADSVISTPGAGSSVLTATAIDSSGNPTVAWWDNSSGLVAASRCTANCSGTSPTWSSLGTIDTGLGPMTFAPTDEPRPVAVTVSGSNTFVAYYTGHQASAPTVTGLGAQPFCSLVLARNSGTGWTYQTVATGSGCDAAAFGAGTQSGRYVTLAQASGGIPVIAYWKQLSATSSEPHYVPCTTATGTLGTDVAVLTVPGTEYGRWVSLDVEPSGEVNLAWFADRNPSGDKFPAVSVSTSFSAPSFSHFAIDFVSGGPDHGRFTSIASIPPGTAANPGAVRKLVVAYRNTAARSAQYSTCSVSGSCSAWSVAQTVGDSTSTDFGRDTQLAVDPATGLLRLAYVDVAHGEVHVLSGDASAPFTLLERFPASSTAGISLAFGSGSRLGFAGSTGALSFFAGP